jgi:crossover junction endodeoxyribonuclease RuvC
VTPESNHDSVQPPGGAAARTRILGIDPGYERCGWAVVECGPFGRAIALLASGTLRTSAQDSFPMRLHQLAAALEQLLVLWQPASMAIEELYFNRNVKTAIMVAEARGVILERAASRGLEIGEYAPTTVKSQLTGSGRADKQQVGYMVRRLTTLGPEAVIDDEADAIAIALCHGMLRGGPLPGRKTRGSSDWAALAAERAAAGGRQ